MSKQLLVISYYWPPGSGPGVQRWLKFVKHLHLQGYKCTVLTVKNGSYPSMDASLSNEIPHNCLVIKTPTWEPFKLFNLLQGKKGKSLPVAMADLKGKQTLFKKLANFIRANCFVPDARIGWNWFAFRKAAQWIQQNPNCIVVTTGPPHSSHLIGLKLKQKFNVFWLADFRDPWTEISYNSILLRTKKSIEKDKKLESSVLQQADKVLVVSEEMKRSFAASQKHIEVLPNGFDQSDFEELRTIARNKQFTIAYIGNFKPNQNIKTIWESLQKMKSNGFNFTLQIVGNLSQLIEESLTNFDLLDCLEKIPFVHHKKAIQYMQKADLLLLPIPKVSKNLGILTGKIYEYLASRTPILAIGPAQGDAAKLLHNLKREPIIDYHQKHQMYNRFMLHYDHWTNKEKNKIKTDEHIIYNRENLTKELLKIVHEKQD